MKFSDFPAEIKNRVKLEVELQGNTYSEETFNRCISAGRSSGGFTWDKAEQSYDFWNSVLCRENFKIFYEKYPKEGKLFGKPFQLNDIVKCISNPYTSDKSCIGKYFQITSQGDLDILNNAGLTALSSYPSGDFNEYNISFKSSMLEISARTQKDEIVEEGFREIPKDVKIGDKFVYYSHLRMDESQRLTRLDLGTICTLVDDDGSRCPYFSYNDVSRGTLDWGYLKPYKEPLSHTVDSCQSNDKSDYFEIGDEVEVINVLGWGEKVKLGLRFIIESVDGVDTIERFNEGCSVIFNKNKYGTNWTKDMLKIVRKGSSNSNNSNSKIHIQYGKVQQTSSPIILGLTLNIKRGTSLRGKTVASTNPQITVGN